MTGSGPKILFVGNDFVGSNATSLRDGLLRLGLSCSTFDTTPWGRPPAGSLLRVAKRLTGGLPGPWRSRLADAVSRQIAREQPDIVVGFKTVNVEPGVWSDVPAGTLVIEYHPDDIFNPENAPKDYLDSLSRRHLVVTTKSFNVEELEAIGATAEFVFSAYDDRWHSPSRAVATNFRVGFIGTRRPDRAGVIRELAELYGRDFLLVGEKWSRDRSLARLATVRPPAYGTEFSHVVAACPVQLGFLNSSNRDLHTCRSLEVPAAGGILVAEDTSEHRQLFGSDAAPLLFGSDGELKAIVRDLQTSASLQQLGRDMTRRIQTGHHTYVDRARQIMDRVGVAA